MAPRWTLPNPTTPYIPPTRVDISPLTQLPEYFQKLKQQGIVNERADQAMAMREQQMKQAQDYRNRALAMQEKRLNAPPAPTAAQRNFQYGQQNPAFNQWRLAGKKAGAPSVNVNLPSQAKKFDEKLGGGFADMALEGMKGSRKARQDIRAFQILRSALQDPNVHQGTGAETAQMLKKGLQSLVGAPVKGVGTGELIGRLSKELALNEKDQLPGPLSNSDVRLLLSLPPGLKNTPEGNRLIIEMGMLQREYVIERNRAMAKYFRDNRGNIDPFTADDILKGVETQYAQKFQQFLPRLKQNGQELPPTSPLAGVPQISSKAERDALPPGTPYIAPDGTQRIKR